MPTITTPNYGILQGLADGINQGLISYQNTKNIQHAQHMQELMSGVERDANGNLQLNPAMQQQRQLQQMQAQRGIQELTPDSDAAKVQSGILKGILENTKAGSGGIIPDSGLSVKDIQEISPLAKSEIGGQYGMLKQLYNPLVQVKEGQLNLAKDNQSSQAVDKVKNNPQLNQYIQRVQGANRIQSQLEDVKSGKIVDTNQFLNDLNTEYVNLLTGSNNAALGKQERTEYRTTAGDLASIIQRIKGSPESVRSPEIMKQLETSVQGLKQTYQRSVNTRAQELQRDYKHNPDAVAAQQKAIQDTIQNYGAPPEQSQASQGLLGQGAQQDPQIAQFAKANNLDYAHAEAIINARKAKAAGNGQ